MTNRNVESPYAQSAKSGPQFHITDYLRVLHKRRWTAGLALLVVFVYGAFSSLKKTPIYEATASVLIEKDQRRSSSLNNMLEDTSDSDSEFYATQYRILQSRALAWRAVKFLKLDAQPAGAVEVNEAEVPKSFFENAQAWAMNLIGAPKKIEPPRADENTTQSNLVSGFLGGLHIQPTRGTHLVDVQYEHPDPAFAAKAANAIANEYKRQSQEQRFLASKETTDWLEKELESQKKKVDVSDLALQQYKETHDAVSLESGQNIVVQQLGDLTSAATKAHMEKTNAELMYRRVMDAEQKKDRALLEAIPAVTSNEFIQKLKTDLMTSTAERAKLATRYVAGGPEMTEVDNRIRVTQSRLDTEIDKVVENVKSEFLGAQEKERVLNAQLDAQKNQTLNLNRKGLEYANLKRESDSNHELYNNLMTHAKETGVTGDFKGSNIQVVDLAEVPRSPFYPQTSHDLFVAFIEGLMLAIGLAFGFEYLDSRIRTPDEIKAHLGLAFLGIVPAVPEPKPDEEQVLLLNRKVPQNFGEAMRAIRTAVIFSSAEDGARSVVVTSTAPSEGKTVVSTNLAAALAQAGQRTLIIDADLRRPRVHTVFAAPQEPGLSNVLVGTTELHEAVRPTAVANLFLLPAGHLPPNPAELLGASRYTALMADLRHQFDWIVIDAPPVLAVTDAAVIANQATGVVFVVGNEMTLRRNAIAAVEQLTAARAHFIGAVLNRVDIENHSYYYSPYYRKDYTRAYERSH